MDVEMTFGGVNPKRYIDPIINVPVITWAHFLRIITILF